jgi:hypothetical protein
MKGARGETKLTVEVVMPGGVVKLRRAGGRCCPEHLAMPIALRDENIMFRTLAPNS